MSLKWIRMLVAPPVGAELGQMHLRRTLPQSKIISKFMKPTRITPTPQQIYKLDILKNTTGLLEQITTEKTSRLLPLDRMENFLKKSLSPTSKLRPSSRCHLRSSQTAPRRNLFNFCQSQNKLRRRMTLMERFHNICQTNKTQPLLEKPGILRPQTRRFQIREYTTSDKSGQLKTSLYPSQDNTTIPGNLELVLNTIKASKAQHDLKAKKIAEVSPGGQMSAQKIFKGWNTAVPALFQELHVDPAGNTCTKCMHGFGAPEQLHHMSAKPLLLLKKSQKDANLMNTKEENLPLAKPEFKYLAKPGNPFLVNPDLPAPKPERTLAKKSQIEPSPTYKIIKNAEKNFLSAKDIDYQTVVHRAKVLLKHKPKHPYPYNLQTLSKTEPLKQSHPETETAPLYKQRIALPLTPSEHKDKLIAKNRIAEIRNQKHLENTAMFSRLSLETAPSKISMKARLDPMMRQSRDLSNQQMPLPPAPTKQIHLKIVMPSLNMNISSFEPMVPPPVPVPCINGRPCQSSQFSEADYRPYHDLAKEDQMKRFVPKSKRLLKVSYPSHKEHIKMNEPSLWRSLNRGSDAKESKKCNDGIKQFEITPKREEPKVKRKSRYGRQKSKIPVPITDLKVKFLNPYRNPDLNPGPVKNSVAVKNLRKTDTPSLKNKDERGTIFVRSDQSMLRSHLNQRKKATKYQMQDVKDGLKTIPCELCGLYHCMSTPQCPLTEWFKNSTTNEVQPQVLTSYLNKRTYGTHSINRPLNSTEELLNVCRYCGLVHSNEHEVCPMKEALKLFMCEKEPTLTNILMRQQCNTLEERLLNMTHLSEVTIRKVASEKMVFQKQPSSTIGDKISGLQGSEGPFERFLPSPCPTIQMCSMGKKSGILDGKGKHLAFIIPPFKVKRTENNLRTNMKSKRDSKYGSAFKAIEKCKTHNEKKYPQFARNLCNLLQDLLHECQHDMRLSENAKITHGNMKFTIEEQDSFKDETKSWVHNITLERESADSVQDPPRSKVPNFLEDTHRSRYNFEIVCSGLKPGTKSVEPSSTRINSAGSRSFNTCCRSTYSKYPRAEPNSKFSRKSVSIESIMSQVQNHDRTSGQVKLRPGKSRVKDRWSSYSSGVRTQPEINKRSSRIHDDVLRIEKLQKCIKILKKRVKEKAKPIRKSLAASEAYLHKDKKIMRISVSTENCLGCQRTKQVKRPKRTKANKLSNTRIWRTPVTGMKDKNCFDRGIRSDLKLPKVLPKAKFPRKFKSMVALNRKTDEGRFTKSQTAKAVGSMIDIPFGQNRMCSSKEVSKRGLKITRQLFGSPPSIKSPRVSMDPKPCCHSDLPQHRNSSRKIDSKSSCKKSPSKPLPPGCQRKLCQDGSNIKEVVMEMLKLPVCEMNLIQARLRNERQKVELNTDGEEFYKFYKGGAHRTSAHKMICVEEFFKKPTPLPPLCPAPIPFCGGEVHIPKFECKKAKKKCRVFKVVVKPTWKAARHEMPPSKMADANKAPCGDKLEVFLPNWSDVKKPRPIQTGMYTNTLCDVNAKETFLEKDDSMEKFFEFRHLRKEPCLIPEPEKEKSGPLGMILPKPEVVKAKLKRYAEECKLRLRKLSPFRESDPSMGKKEEVAIVEEVKEEEPKRYKKVQRNKAFIADCETKGDGIGDEKHGKVFKCAPKDDDDEEEKRKVIDGDALEKVAVVEERPEDNKKRREKRSKRSKSRKRNNDVFKCTMDQNIISFEGKVPEEPKALTLKACPPELFLPMRQTVEEKDDDKLSESKMLDVGEEICIASAEEKSTCAPKEDKCDKSSKEDNSFKCAKEDKSIECQKEDKLIKCEKENEGINFEPEGKSIKSERKDKSIKCEKEDKFIKCETEDKSLKSTIEDKCIQAEEDRKSQDSNKLRYCKDENEGPGPSDKFCKDTDVQTDDDSASGQSKASWTNMMTDVVKGARSIQYAKISKADMDTICQSVLKEINSRKAKTQEEGKDPKEDKCLPGIEDQKKIEKETKFCKKSWKYLSPAEEECKKLDTEMKATEDKTGIQLQKCLSDVRRCLGEYKQALKDLDLVPNMAPHFDYKDEMISASDAHLNKKTEPEQKPCDSTSITSGITMASKDEIELEVEELTKGPWPASKFCYMDPVDIPKAPKIKEDSCPNVDLLAHNLKMKTLAIDPLKATAKECQILGHIQETASILVTPSYIPDSCAQEIHDTRDSSRYNPPRTSFQRPSCQNDSKTRGIHCTTGVGVVKDLNPSEALLKSLDLEKGKSACLDFDKDKPACLNLEKVDPGSDEPIIMEGVDQVTVYYPRAKTLNLELVVRAKPHSKVLRTPSVDTNVEVPDKTSKDATLESESGACTRAGPHGVIQNTFKSPEPDKTLLPKCSPSPTCQYNYTNLTHNRRSSSFSAQLSLFWEDMLSNLVLTPKAKVPAEIQVVVPTDDIWPRKYYPTAHPPYVNRKSKVPKPDLRVRPITPPSCRMHVEGKKEETAKGEHMDEQSSQKKATKALKPQSVDGRHVYCHIERGPNASVHSGRSLRRETSLTNILVDACKELRTSAEDCCRDLVRTFKRKS